MTTPATTTRTPRPSRTAFACAILAVSTILVYLNTLNAPFIFDDLPQIADNTSIRALVPIDGWLHDSRRPLVSLTLAINHAISGAETWSYHALNIAIHTAAALALFALLTTCGRSERLPSWIRERRHTIALAAALLWTLHPLNTQAVTYTIQRAESMMALFYLLTLLATALAALANSRRARALCIAAATAACALGMASKGVMITAPLAALLLDRALFAGKAADAARSRWPLYAGLAASCLILVATGVIQQTLTPESASGTQRTVGLGFEAASPTTYLFTQAQVIPHYLRLSVLPVGLNLDHRWPYVTDLANAILPGLLVLALLAASLYGLIKNTWWGLTVALFFLILAPTSSFVPVLDAAVEHRMYLPLACITLLASIGIHAVSAKFTQRDTRAALAITAALALALGAATIDRNRDYRSHLAMWQDVTTKAPHNVRAWVGLGRAHEQANNPEAAIAAYERALVAGPGFVPALTNLGRLSNDTGRPSQAADALTQVVAQQPTNASVWYELAVAYQSLGRTPDAADAFERVVELAEQGEPTAEPAIHAASLTNLGAIAFAAGDAPRSIDLLTRATRVDPSNVQAHFNLAVALHSTGDPDGALDQLERVAELDPDHAGAARLRTMITPQR